MSALWLSLDEAALLLDRSKGQVSRLINGTFPPEDVERDGRGRLARVRAEAVVRLWLADPRRPSRKHTPPEMIWDEQELRWRVWSKQEQQEWHADQVRILH